MLYPKQCLFLIDMYIKKNIKALLILFILLITGCSAIRGIVNKRKAIKNCKFTILNIEDVIWNPLDPEQKIEIKIRLGIKNPEDNIDVVLDKITARLLINDAGITEISHNAKIEVKKGKEKDFIVSAILTMETINNTMLAAMNAGRAVYKIEGTAYFKTVFGEISFTMTILEKEWTSPEEKEL